MDSMGMNGDLMGLNSGKWIIFMVDSGIFSMGDTLW